MKYLFIDTCTSHLVVSIIIDNEIKTYFDEKTGDFCENEQGANAFGVDLGLGDKRTFENMLQKYRKTNKYEIIELPISTFPIDNFKI